MVLRLAWTTDPGLRREENEDSVLVMRDEAGLDALLLVCDGMGGHAAGKKASSMAVDVMAEAIRTDGLEGADRGRLITAFNTANAAVHEASRRVSEWAGMGSTLTAVAIRDSHLAVLNVGDSPAYVVRDGEVHAISQDHSWPAEQVRLGLIRPSDAVDHPYKHRLTRALGIWDRVQPFTAVIDLEPNDLVIVCSDGVETAGVGTGEVRRLLESDLEQGVIKLVERCNEMGGPDNITVAVARNEPEPEVVPEGPKPKPVRSRPRR